jgi:hypothetical protein
MLTVTNNEPTSAVAPISRRACFLIPQNLPETNLPHLDPEPGPLVYPD